LPSNRFAYCLLSYFGLLCLPGTIACATVVVSVLEASLLTPVTLCPCSGLQALCSLMETVGSLLDVKANLVSNSSDPTGNEKRRALLTQSRFLTTALLWQ
jgi:hypothetical protein